MFSCIYTGGLSVSLYFVVLNYAIRETYLSVIALFLELECGAVEDEKACPADLQKVKGIKKGIKNQSSYMKKSGISDV